MNEPIRRLRCRKEKEAVLEHFETKEYYTFRITSFEEYKRLEPIINMMLVMVGRNRFMLTAYKEVFNEMDAYRQRERRKRRTDQKAAKRNAKG